MGLAEGMAPFGPPWLRACYKHVTYYSVLFGKRVVQLSDMPRRIVRHAMSHLRI